MNSQAKVFVSWRPALCLEVCGMVRSAFGDTCTFTPSYSIPVTGVLSPRHSYSKLKLLKLLETCVSTATVT